MDELLPCPFCGSKDLREDFIYEEDEGEIEGVECMVCDAIAPKVTWNERFINNYG